MTNNSPRHAFGLRARLLSVTGVSVLASVLIWHAQLAEFVGIGSADERPVVSGSGAQGTAPPPGAVITPGTRPTRPAAPPTRRPSSKPSSKPRKTAGADTSYDESSTEGLTPELRTGLVRAIKAAKADGVTITITSGRRSAAKQRKLLAEAIEKYGSYRAATRWVLPPEYSAHVQGKAIDVGPQAGMTWLDKYGYRYGICRRYDNEPWHFEALTTPGRQCPPREPYATVKNN
jgi:D-alanyl-D-alanine carboxypeptidase